MISDGDGVDAHLNDGIIVAAGLGHVTEVEDVLFVNFELFEEMSHAEDFIHTWCNCVDRGSAADFIVEFRGEFFATRDDLLAFFAVGVPGIFGFGAGVLTKGREGDLGEAVFDDFVAGL